MEARGLRGRRLGLLGAAANSSIMTITLTGRITRRRIRRSPHTLKIEGLMLLQDRTLAIEYDDRQTLTPGGRVE